MTKKIDSDNLDIIIFVRKDIKHDKMILADTVRIDMIRKQKKISFDIQTFEYNLSPKEMLDDFNIPLGKGCSGFIRGRAIKYPDPTFSMNIEILEDGSYHDSQYLAYDRSAGLFRRESILNEGNMIWDLKLGLLYASGQNNFDDEGSSIDNDCSIMYVTDTKLSPALRPYGWSEEGIPSVSEFLGPNILSLVGHKIVDGIPCSIYESIVRHAPLVFDISQIEYEDPRKQDYLVQYYLIDESIYDLEEEDFKRPAQFRPMQMSLYVRYQDDPKFKLIRFYKIEDFRPDLGGNDLRIAETFMSSDCYINQPEQLRLELDIVFDDIHPRPKLDVHKTILSENILRLEDQLIGEIMKRLQLSRLHLFEYELELLDSHLDLELILSDRTDAYKVEYWGSSVRPSHSEFKTQSIEYVVSSEEQCLLETTQTKNVGLLFYCPDENLMRADCIVVWDVFNPEITRATGDSIASCQVYKLKSISNQLETAIVDLNYLSLRNMSLEFDAQVGTGSRETMKLRGHILNIDLIRESRPKLLNSYSYSIDTDEIGNEDSLASRKTRSVSTIDYKSQEDCKLTCSQDIKCRSYSYCFKDDNRPKCIISSLDLKENNVDMQMGSIEMISDKVQVKGQGDLSYEIIYTENCNIYEQDHLYMFRQTTEFVLIEDKYINQILKAPTSAECARLSLKTESSTSRHISMFAYCSTSRNCLTDETMIKNWTLNSDSIQQQSMKGSICRLYRKKYQTYFTISSKSMASAPVSLEISTNSIEDCARECWVEHQQTCPAFDFCYPNTCRIHSNSNNSEGINVESKNNCLYFGRHSLEPVPEIGFWKRMPILVLCMFIVAGILVGFAIGIKMNNRFKLVKESRGSDVAQSNGGQTNRMSIRRMFGFSNFKNDDDNEDENDQELPTNSIQLDVMRPPNQD